MMRLIALCLAGAGVLVSLAAAAEEKSETRQRLESFQSVAFGSFLDSRCGFLSAHQAIEMEWSFETAYDALKSDVRTADIAQIIRESASEAAASGQYACDSQMAEVTAAALPESRRLLAALSRPPFDEETSYPELLSAYLANAAAASAIEASCRLLAPDRRAQLFDGYQEAVEKIRERFGEEAIERAETAASATAATIARSHCSRSMRPVLASLFTDLERLRRGLTRLEAVSP